MTSYLALAEWKTVSILLPRKLHGCVYKVRRSRVQVVGDLTLYTWSLTWVSYGFGGGLCFCYTNSRSFPRLSAPLIPQQQSCKVGRTEIVTASSHLVSFYGWTWPALLQARRVAPCTRLLSDAVHITVKAVGRPFVAKSPI